MTYRHGDPLQALRRRGLRQERHRARPPALPLPVLRLELHRHAAEGYRLALKVAAVQLYLSGLSINQTAKLLGVATPTGQAWIERFGDKPAPEGRAVVVELNEMWHSLKLKKVRQALDLEGLRSRYRPLG